jgi:hypothetical protein
MISVGPPPPYANIEPLTIQYYSQCLQSLIENLELCLDEGLELPRQLGTSVNLDDLMRMDSVSKTQAAATSISSGALTINEARKTYYDRSPVPGGDTPYLQQQYWPVSQLAARPIPDGPAAPPATSLPPADEDDTDDDDEKTMMVLHEKAMDVYAA